jgi:hypothetical protein
VFDVSGNFLFKFGSEGTGDGQFGSQRFFGQGAEGVAVDGAGRIVVADADNHRVQVFDAAGNFLYKFGAEGTGVGQFRYPRGVAADSAGRIVVADSGNIRIQVLAPDCNGNGVPDPEEVASGIGDPCSPSFIRGDCDGDGDACSGVNDALTMLSWLFRGDTRPPCIAACDSNGDGETELTDAVFGLDFCFKGTAPPPAPGPECGPGTETDANLGCATSPKPCQLGGQP